MSIDTGPQLQEGRFAACVVVRSSSRYTVVVSANVAASLGGRSLRRCQEVALAS